MDAISLLTDDHDRVKKMAADGTRSAGMGKRNPHLRSGTMRAVECPCGEYLQARNDGELLVAVEQHANAEHEGEYSEAELKVLVNTAAYDVRDG